MTSKRSATLPLQYDQKKTDFASQEPDQTFYLDTVGQMTSEQIREKIAEFETNKQRYIDDILKKIQIIERRQGNYYYFIGRLNPPHEGHIEALLSVIKMAIDTNGKAIILLGSGPKGERTSKDPLDFNLKKDFVVAKLKDRLKEEYGEDFDVDRLFEPGGQVEILEMGKPVYQIQSAIQNDMENLLDTLNKIYTFRISGDKDGGEDLKKLEFIENGLRKAGIKKSNGVIIEISTDVIPQKAVEDEGQARSATQVRKDASEGGIDYFMEKHNTFYTTSEERDFAREIYDAIVTAPKETKKRKGGKSRKQKLTNRRLRKHKRKTKRRKTKKTKRRLTKRKRHH